MAALSSTHIIMDSIHVRRLSSIVRFSSITNTISIILPSRDLALVGVLGKAHYILMLVFSGRELIFAAFST